MNALITQFFNVSFELVALAAILIILSKMIFSALSFMDFAAFKDFYRVQGFERRIPPQKASLCGQRTSRRVANSVTFGF